MSEIISFFAKDSISLFNASCLDKAVIEASSTDLIITSPPYNVGIEYNSSDDSNEYQMY